MTIQLSDGRVFEQDGIMAIETVMGALFVERAGDPDNYPGFYISLRRPGGNDFTPILVEVDQSERNEPEFKMHYWSPENNWDDPVWNVALTPEEFDEAWKDDEE